MTHLGFVVRLLMLAACLVPFTNIRQVGAILALKSVVPTQTAPMSQEDDSEREEQPSGRERAAHLRVEGQSLDEQLLYVLPPILTAGSSVARSARPAPSPLDPFRNGLGSPYRC
jgi:hypothetical protein